MKYYETLEEYRKDKENLTPKKTIISKKVIIFAFSSLIILIIALFSILLVSSGVFSSTHHYSSFYGTFDLPKEWKVSSSENMGLRDTHSGFIVINIWDPTDKKHLTTITYTRYESELADMGYAHKYDLYTEIKPTNAKIVSNKTIKFHGSPTYELKFNEKTPNGLIKGTILLNCNKKNCFVYKAPAERYPKINDKFNIILNSFEYF